MKLRRVSVARRTFPLALRLSLVALLFNLLHPAEPRATPQEQQRVITTLPQLCVHTRLIDEVWEWKIQRSLQMVRELGAGTIVEFFPWAYAEAVPGRFNWQQMDRILDHARNQGIQVIARLGLVPAWARVTEGDTGASTLNSLPREAWDDFARYVAAFARRYHADVQHLIIWNEPNLAFEWGYDPVTPDDYVALLRVVHDAVRAASPASLLLAAGPAPTLEPAGSPHAINDLDWLEDTYAAGAANWSDGIALHSYGFRHSADALPARDQLNFRRLELHRETLLQHAGHDAAVFLTESGWNDDPRHDQAVSPARRIRYTLDALDHARQHWPWLERLCLWALRYPAPTWNWRDGYTLLTPEFTRKPIYQAIQDLALGRRQGESLWLPPPAVPS